MSDHDIPEGLEIRAFNPIDAFETTIFDLVNIIETYQADESGTMDPMVFLKATKKAGDRLTAISTMTVAGLLGAVSSKIPDDVRSDFEAEVRLAEMMETPEEKHRKMIQALKDVTKRQQ